jgi:hypothetical protein
MKKTLIVAFTMACAVSVMAQGKVTFNNRVVGTVVAPVYGVNPANPTEMLQGNATDGTPAGTTVYAGPKLDGAGYSAQLFWGTGLGLTMNDLVNAGPMTIFRAGAAAGFISTVGVDGTLTGSTIGSDLTLQLRAWDNMGGTVMTWDEAVAQNVAMGYSKPFEHTAVGGGSLPPKNLVGLESFNIAVVPEPSSLALLGLGAAAMLIFRRRD